MTSDAFQAELDRLRTAIAGLEAQRAILGDGVLEPALDALRLQIAALEARAAEESAEERRIVTILFSDIVGSTALAEKLDPEDWREAVAGVHAMAGSQIQRHEGSVLQYLGDGLLAIFGAQLPGERDPENAIRAGLEIQAGLTALDSGLPIQMRVGIHTGLVVLGEIGSDARREYTATGDAVNLAARLQSAAPAGGVLISHDTYRYVRGVFDVAPQPPLSVKGKRDLVRTYVVRRARPRPFRTVTRGVAGIDSQTVGRDAELSWLRSAAESTFAHNSVVWAQLVGQPGLGKSRLLSDMTDFLALRPEDIGLLRARAFQGDERQPFRLVRRAWFDRFQVAEDAPLAEAEAKWQEKFLKLRGAGYREAAHALGLLVGLPFRDSPHIGAMRHDPAQVKGRAFVVSRDLMASMRDRVHVVILLEDLHWADASSWEYLAQVVLDQEPAAHGLFVLATARPEWRPPDALRQHPGYTQIDLAALTEDACRALTSALLESVEDVPEEVRRQIAERSEGVPYFVEELVNWMIDTGVINVQREPWRFEAGRLEASPLPATLQHLLLTRLSALKEAERLVLQRGAIFGRHFWDGGLQALGAAAADSALAQLRGRGFVFMQPESSFTGESEWSFHHNLLHEVTYESVLKRERRAMHRAAASWLEAQAREAGRLDEFAGVLGEHAERAEDHAAAAEWLVLAGERAKARGAPLEARHYFERALELAPAGDSVRRWRALLGRTDVLSALGETEARRGSVKELLALARELDDHRLAEAHYRQALYLDHTGDLRAAMQAYETALAAARRDNHFELETLLLGAKVICQSRLGDQNGAAATAEEALARARQVEESTAARALNNVAVFYVESGDLAKAAQLHSQQAAIHRRLGDRAAEASALLNLGYDYVLLGMYGQGRDALERCLHIFEAVGQRRERAYAQLNLGLAQWRIGDSPAARQVLAQARRDLDAMNDRFGGAAGWTYLALTQEQDEEYAEATRSFVEAHAVFGAIGVGGYATDALAGLARCARAQGQLDEARTQAAAVWEYLSQHGTQGMEFPARAYQTCAEIFEAAGPVEQMQAAVEQGYRSLIQRAERISNLDWGRSFLTNVPEHRAILAMHDRVVGQATQSTHTHTGG